MKKLLLVIIVLFTVSQMSYAQRGRKKEGYKGYYGVSIGPSFPMGDFKGTSDTKEGQGFAITGIHIAFANVGYKLAGPFGLAAQVFAGANRMDVKSIGFDDKDAYWAYGGVMVGPLGSFDFGPMTVDVRPVVGLAYVATPELNSNSGGVLFKSDRNSAVSYDLAASLRYHFSEKGCIGLNLDYFSTKVDFKRDEVSYSQQISTLGVGLVLTFGI